MGQVFIAHYSIIHFKAVCYLCLWLQIWQYCRPDTSMTWPPTWSWSTGLNTMPARSAPFAPSRPSTSRNTWPRSTRRGGMHAQSAMWPAAVGPSWAATGRRPIRSWPWQLCWPALIAIIAPAAATTSASTSTACTGACSTPAHSATLCSGTWAACGSTSRAPTWELSIRVTSAGRCTTTTTRSANIRTPCIIPRQRTKRLKASLLPKR